MWTRYCSCSQRERIINGRRPTHCYRCSLEVDPVELRPLNSDVSR